MAKVKVKDQEFEVPDEVAALVADETGVPFRNRAAEARRKFEKLEREREEAAAAVKAQPAQQAQPAQRAVPYQPGQYTYQPQAQAYAGYVYNPATGQYVMNPIAYQQPQQQEPALTADEARRLAQEEFRAVREREEFEVEQRRLNEEWSTYDDDKDKVKDYLRSKGYSDDQIGSFGPRDLRLVKDAYGAATRASRANKRSPQEVVLDIGGGGGVLDDEVSARPLFDNPEKIKSLSKADFQKLVGETRMKPRLDDE